MPPVETNPLIGTNSTPYFVPCEEQPDIVKTGDGYYYIQVYGAQAFFAGHWYDGANYLAIVSDVNLHLGTGFNPGDQDIRSIMQYRPLEKKRIATQLGFSPMLVDFVPAKMNKVSVSIEYQIYTTNYLKEFASLITDKDLLSVVSLAPGVALVAQTISKITQKVLTKLPENEKTPILQFSGDFDLVVNGLKAGYYVILGSDDPDNPLPTENPQFEVTGGGGLKMNGEPVTQVSYVILRIDCVKAIRDHVAGRSAWRDKIKEVERLIKELALDQPPNPDAMRETWEKQCRPLLREASALLKDDPNFLESEAEEIYWQAYQKCTDLIAGRAATVRQLGVQSSPVWEPDSLEDRQFLGIPDDVNVRARVREYEGHLDKARIVFRGLSESEPGVPPATDTASSEN